METTTATQEPLTISVDEAAARLGISRGLAYESVHRGEIPSIRLGRKILVPRQRFEDWLAGEQEADAAAA